MKIGKLKIIDRAKNTVSNRIRFWVICDCGQVETRTLKALKITGDKSQCKKCINIMRSIFNKNRINKSWYR